MMFSNFNTEDSKDLGKKRTLPLPNGNKIHAERTDPYGFWKVSYEKGQVPESLSGAFTSFERAEKAIITYLKELEAKAQAAEDKAAKEAERPKIKYKAVKDGA